MQKSRDLDLYMAQKVLGYKTFNDKSGKTHEELATGVVRPLRSYSQDISAAWEIVEKLGVSLIPVEQGWFAMVGHAKSWESPADFMSYLQTAEFANSGAAVGETAPMTICLAAMKAVEKQEAENQETLLN